MKSKEEILEKIIKENPFPQASHCIEEWAEMIAKLYADQFKPKWINCGERLPEFIPGVKGYGMNTYKVLVLGMEDCQLMDFNNGKWFWGDGVPEFKVMYWLEYELPEKPEL